MDCNWWSIIANIIICIINIIISIVAYKVRKRESNRTALLEDLISFCDSIEKDANRYWSENIRDRKNCANSLKSHIKKARGAFDILQKKYIKDKEIGIECAKKLNNIDKEATGATFETSSFTIDTHRSDNISILIENFRADLRDMRFN